MRSVLTLALLVGSAHGRRAVPDYELNLDLEPEERYAGLFDVPDTDFNATVWKFYEQSFANHPGLTDVLYRIAAKRGPEPDDEMQREIEGLATLSRLPLEFVQSMQMLYEIQTLMVMIMPCFQHNFHSRPPTPSHAFPCQVPLVNFSGHGNPKLADYPPGHFPPGYEGLVDLPWRGPGCTGIIALDTTANTVNHARNLDFQPVDIMANLVYNGIFTKGGKEVFRSQMVAGYTCIVTGANMVSRN